ncbi:protein of unknown function DUF214 [Xylanimonas cellulosilytica DSM 15894]|uniref:ABC3 transporter permease protein domain-containing protein n=1 Tax=Xylanimonas cellulosilytica (strain DSM 15894 / JCM 12276 / CECT 5975 / KCTC 9989 / LMG 20990 / NBRC 107835 / XIL07) TaxID=446471 RepID=D1BZT2_XYLCX|nr:ABC transporter permease [Xylanimonas cellulosilytica]ACZ32060.1 protein of unknown function DUF214 [Xylanimonas cellulosilytica DSM 15894]
MGRIALRGIRAHLGRFVMSVLAVALGVAFMAGTLSLRTMLSSTFDGIVEAGTAADAYVRGTQTTAGSNPMDVGASGLNPVDMAMAEQIEALDAVAAAIPETTAPVVLVGKDGTAVQSTQAPSFAIGFDADRDPTTTIVAGRAPQGADEVALEEATLKSSGLAIGDKTTLVVNGQVTPVEVVGEASLGGPMAGATIVLLDPAEAAELFAPDGRVQTIAVYAADGVGERELVDAITPVLSADSAAVTGESLRAETRDDIQEMLGFLTTFLVVFAAIALFVGAFIIANTFSMWVRQRMRELALLRAVGASPRQVFGSIVLQAAAVGLIGSAVGVVLGLGLVELARVGLQAVGMDLAGDIPLTVPTIVVCLVVGVGVSVVAAAIPARRAALVPAVEAMRDEVTTDDRSSTWRVAVGLALTTAGAGLIVTSGVSAESDWAVGALGAGTAAVLIGAIMLSPWLARVVIRWLGAPFAALAKPMGALARGNAVRNPKRTAATAGALMIGMALVAAVSVLAASVNASVSTAVETEARSDLVLQGPMTGTIPVGALDAVAGLPAVGRIDPDWWSTLLVTTDGAAPADDDARIVMGAQPGMLGGTLRPELVSGEFSALDGGQALVAQSAAEDEGWEVGNTLTLTSADGSRDIVIAGVVDTQTLGTSVIVGRDVLDELVPTERQIVDAAFVVAAPGVGVDELRAQVAHAVSPYVVVSVMDAEEFVDGLAGQINQVLAVLYALLGLSILIAVLGIVNTLAMSVLERTREIGLLRAVGLGRAQLAGTVTIESLLTAVFGTVLGLVIGVGIAAVFPRVLADQGLNELVIPWGSLGAMLALAGVVGVVAAAWPARRAARLRVLDAIAYA